MRALMAAPELMLSKAETRADRRARDDNDEVRTMLKSKTRAESESLNQGT